MIVNIYNITEVYTYSNKIDSTENKYGAVNKEIKDIKGEKGTR